MEVINKVKPVGYDPEEDDQELQNLNDLPNKQDDQQPPEDDDDESSEDEAKKKTIQQNTTTTAISSGNASEETEKSSLAKKAVTPIKDETLSEDSGEDSAESPSASPDKNCKLFEGVIPKDLEQKKEMMSFIAYPQNLENACKLIACNKAVSFAEGPHDKHRIFVSGSTIMSTKLTVSIQNCKRVCEQIQDQEIF